jgi:hypothetical protein
MNFASLALPAAFAFIQTENGPDLAATRTLQPVHEIQREAESTAAITERLPGWANELTAELRRICLLPEKWDGDRAHRVRPEVARYLMSVLAQAMGQHTAAPSVAPLRDGGIQLSWYRNGVEIDLFFKKVGEVDGTFEEVNAGKEAVDKIFTNDLSDLRSWLDHV